MKDIDPSQPNEYILKGVVNAAVGQENNSVDYLSSWNQKYSSSIYNITFFEISREKVLKRPNSTFNLLEDQPAIAVR